MRLVATIFTLLGLLTAALGCEDESEEGELFEEEEEFEEFEDPGCDVSITGPGSVPDHLLGICHIGVRRGPGFESKVEGDLRSAEGVDPGNKGCAPFPLGGFDGVIALMERGDCTFEEKVNNAADAGATLVIIFNNDGDYLKPAIVGEQAAIPSVFIGQTDGDAIASWCKEHPTDATISIQPF